jgi:hypothetical protein
MSKRLDCQRMIIMDADGKIMFVKDFLSLKEALLWKNAMPHEKHILIRPIKEKQLNLAPRGYDDMNLA